MWHTFFSFLNNIDSLFYERKRAFKTKNQFILKWFLEKKKKRIIECNNIKSMLINNFLTNTMIIISVN